MKLDMGFEKNTRVMDNLLSKDPTLKIRDFENRAHGLRCRLYFSDGMVSSQLLMDGVVRPVIEYDGELPGDRTLDYISLVALGLPEVKWTDETEDMISAVTYGDALLFAGGQEGCLIIGCKNFPYRAISEPEDEKVAKGPKEGFVEPLMMNISMLKRRLRTNRLKLEMTTVGKKSGTACCICYLEDTVDREVLEKVKSGVESVEIDGVFSSSYIDELINPTPFALFQRAGATARPDVAAAKLLEGRVLVIVDGTPEALTAPYVFLENFQSPEDYYVSYHHAFFSRFLRMAGFFIAISLVPIYIAILNYHPGTLSVGMILSIVQAQAQTPFSAVSEAIILMLSFDLLREAGLRTPASVGQTLSIVGALVLGQSAVEANIVSPAMVIVVALSGVTGLITNNLKNQIIILRLMLIAFASLGGLWGYVLGMSMIIGMLAGKKSFGVDYLTGMPTVAQGSHEDSIVRMPFKFMKKRGRFLSREKD